MISHIMPEISPARLAQMIDVAMAQPQCRPVPRQATWAKTLWDRTAWFFAPQARAVCASLCLILLVTGLTLSTPLQIKKFSVTDTDSLTEVSDLMTLEILDNMS